MSTLVQPFNFDPEKTFTFANVSVTGNANITGNLNVTGTIGGTVANATTSVTVTGNSQGNITSVGTLTTLAVTGDVAIGNTATGGQALQISRPGTVFAELRANSGGVVTRVGSSFSPAGGSFGSVGTYSDHDLYLFANSTSRMALTSTGQVRLIQSGMRIVGEFSDSTANNRPAFQSYAFFGNTYVGAVPNRTTGISAFRSHNASDASNAGFTSLEVSTAAASIISGTTGSATQLPLTFVIGTTEAARISTDGRMGIGTNSPTARLHVRGSGYFADEFARVTVEDPNVINGPVAELGVNGTSHAYVSSNSDKPLVFSTAFAERMRITSSGNVGIGTDSPTARLEIQGTSSTGSVTNVSSFSGLKITGNQANPGVTGITFQDGGGGGAGIGLGRGASYDTFVSVYTNPTGTAVAGAMTERMRITSSGNVGIGTSTPAHLLDIVGPTSPSLQLFETGTGTTLRLVISQTTSGSVYNSSWGSGGFGTHIFQIGNLERMRLDSNGNLGIGTSSPVINSNGRTVHLHAPGSGQWSLFHATNGESGALGGDGSIYGQIGLDAYVFNYEAGNLIFGTNSGERMRITSGGNVGIGTSSPSHKLHVSGTIASGNNAGFVNDVYFHNTRNPIWSFGNATSYGISYFQGTSGIGGSDTIGIHPNGVATSGGSAFTVTPSASYVNSNVVLHAGNYASYALPLSGGNMTGTINSSATSLIIGNNGGVVRGYLYNDSSGFGFLNSSGNWAAHVPMGTSNLVVGGNLQVAGTITELSTRKIKANIRPIQNALSVVTQLQGVTYDTVDGRTFDEPGLIAEDTADVVRELVTYDDQNQPLGIKYSKTVAYLIEAVKELTARVQTLEGK